MSTIDSINFTAAAWNLGIRYGNEARARVEDAAKRTAHAAGRATANEVDMQVAIDMEESRVSCLLSLLKEIVRKSKAVAYSSYRVPGAADALPAVWMGQWERAEPEWFDLIRRAESVIENVKVSA